MQLVTLLVVLLLLLSYKAGEVVLGSGAVGKTAGKLLLMFLGKLKGLKILIGIMEQRTTLINLN